MSGKVLLIYPQFPRPLGVNIPLGLFHLATFLKSKQFEVKMIDCTMEEDYEDLIKEEIQDALCVGISSMTTQIPHARNIALFIKDRLKSKVPIIFGGVHPTLYPDQTVREPYIDYAVIGEGELALFNLLQVIQSDDHRDLLNIAGIAYRNSDGSTQINFSRKDNFSYEAMPEFDYTILNPRVIKAYKKEGMYFPLLTSRGCPYRCSFCINVVTKNNKWRAFSASRTVSEIERIVNMGFNKIWFWDENFFTDKKRIQETLDLLEAKKIIIDGWVEGRADYIRPNYLNQEILKRLKKCGFNRFGFGYESGSQKILNYLQKDITVEDILTSARQCTEAGIRISSSFMIGLPAEREEDIRGTVKIIGKILAICKSCGINGPILYRPYPGSKIYLECLKTGWKEPQNLKEWSDRVISDFTAVPNPYKLPWINNAPLVNMVHFYTYTISASFKNLFFMFREYCQMTAQKKYFFYLGIITLLFLSSIGKLRYKISFYRFLIEKKIFFKYHPNLDY